MFKLLYRTCFIHLLKRCGAIEALDDNSVEAHLYFPLGLILVFPSSSRQLALKALNERLKRVEDQSAWPSMDDEEDDDDDEVRTDTQPLLPGGRDPSSTSRAAGGPVGASLSSTSSSSLSQSGGAPSTGGAQHPESSIISFEDAPSRS